MNKLFYSGHDLTHSAGKGPHFTKSWVPILKKKKYIGLHGTWPQCTRFYSNLMRMGKRNGLFWGLKVMEWSQNKFSGLVTCINGIFTKKERQKLVYSTLGNGEKKVPVGIWGCHHQLVIITNRLWSIQRLSRWVTN